MLSERLHIPWKTFIVTNEMLDSGAVHIWFASPEPCYTENDCVIYEQHRITSLNTPLAGWRSFRLDDLTFEQLQRTFVQVGGVALAPAAERLPQGFVGWIDPVRIGSVTISRNRSPFY